MKKEYEEFRINEYADRFTISKKYIEKNYKTVFHYIFGISHKIETWRLITKKGEFTTLYNLSCPCNFETKEECLKWIDDYYNYPIYHYINLTNK